MYYSLSVCIINVQVFVQFGFDLDFFQLILYYYALINDFEYLDKLYALFEVIYIYIPFISALLQTIASVLFCLFPLLALGSMFWVACWFALFYRQFHFFPL